MKSTNLRKARTGIFKHKSGNKCKTIAIVYNNNNHHNTIRTLEIIINATATEFRNSYVDYEIMVF